MELLMGEEEQEHYVCSEFKISKHNNNILFPRFHTWMCFLFYSKSINIRHIF